MSFILYFIRNIVDKGEHPAKILLYFVAFDTRKSTNMNNFKHFIINNSFLESELKESLKNIFYLFQKHYRALCRFAYHYKIKRARHASASTDLRSNPLYSFPPHQKIQILENDTIYHFRLSDLIMMWKSALTHASYMHPAPQNMCNPYTNIPIKKHNLYNIFFKIHFSSLHCPFLITELFKLDFNILKFKINFYNHLKDNALEDFSRGGDIQTLFEDVLNMFEEYKTILISAKIDRTGNSIYKKNIVNKTRYLLKYYYLIHYSHNPLITKESIRKIKILLLAFEDYNKGFGKKLDDYAT